MENEVSTKTKIANIKKSGKPKKIKESLIEELERNGNVKDYYTSLVDDYITMWISKELLKQDIEERGVRVYYDNGGGQKGYKKNDSVEQLVKINAQMLKLLSELNIKPSNDLVGDDDDEL
ncbi:MAG: P27 family phage terminase small subunit [Roseburia sp.]|nr:P27 family phage terminase small subunit [Roseburia sp.]